MARRLRGKTRKDHQKLTSKLSEPELAQSMAGVGIVVQHDKDGKLPIVDLGSPSIAPCRLRDRVDLIGKREDTQDHQN